MPSDTKALSAVPLHLMAGTPQHCTLRDPSSNLPKRKRRVTCFCVVPDMWPNFRIKYRASRAKSGPNRWDGYHSEDPHPHLLGLHLTHKWRRYHLSHSGSQDSGSTGRREENLCENICAAFLRFDACRCQQPYTFQCTVSCVTSDGTPPALTVDTATVTAALGQNLGGLLHCPQEQLPVGLLCMESLLELWRDVWDWWWQGHCFLCSELWSSPFTRYCEHLKRLSYITTGFKVGYFTHSLTGTLYQLALGYLRTVCLRLVFK